MDAFSDIQYSTNGSGGSSNIKECPFFGGISIKKDKRMCQGIKFCQFTDQEFVNQEHCSVDFDSETFKNLFLAVKESSCPFKKENIPCDGRTRIGRMTNYQTQIVTYFIGCDKFKQGDQWHRFIKIKPEEIYFLAREMANCSMIIPRNCRRKKCDIPHLNNGTAVCGDIIEKSCLVQFIKIIPHNIAECPFVALICIGVHNHPPPPSERIPAGIKNNLQSLIEQAIYQDNTTTSRSILSGNLIKAYFNKDILAEVHVSLNNIDKLRYLIGKAYKNLHPFDLFTNNGQVIITCMLAEQAKRLIALEWFQIDVSFKRVKGEINEFEINTYDSNHHLISTYSQRRYWMYLGKGLGLALHDLDHERDWETHLTFIFKSCLVHFERNLHHKAFEKNTKNLIRQIPSASSKDEVNILLQQIKDTNDDGIEEDPE
ncbi:unnamed protein product [Rhizophagus irregularis]|nr:unnamed protein product [Rhizophagus irregularis]